MTTEQWFLSAEERGNVASAIDRRQGDGRGWTDGNAVTPLVRGAAYFARLHQELSSLGPGDQVWFLDWRGDAGQRLAGPGTELGSVLAEAVRRGATCMGWCGDPIPTRRGTPSRRTRTSGRS